MIILHLVNHTSKYTVNDFDIPLNFKDAYDSLFILKAIVQLDDIAQCTMVQNLDWHQKNTLLNPIFLVDAETSVQALLS